MEINRVSADLPLEVMRQTSRYLINRKVIPTFLLCKNTWEVMLLDKVIKKSFVLLLLYQLISQL